MNKNQHDKRLKEHQLRDAAEAQLANSQPSEILARPAEGLLHELSVHQIELEMQNEALRQTQHALEESRDRYIDLYEFAPVGYLTLNVDGMITEINLTGATLLGWERNKLIHKSLRMLVVAEDQDKWVRHFISVKKQTENSRIELSLQRGDGTVFQAQLDFVSNAATARITLTDITKNKEAEAEIRRLAYYDPLTNLANRRLLQDRLDLAIMATARNAQYGAMFFIDLDHFKALNDARGHDVGDLLLIDVAQRLRKAVREHDTVARQGGDEFVVLMEDLGTTVNEAAILAAQLGNKLREALVAPFNLNGYEYHCKISVGVGLFHAHDTVEDLFKHADLALYQAKTSGRDKLRFFDPAMQIAIDQRGALEDSLCKAVSLDQLRLYYQPQVDAAQRVVGVEALLRWQHPLFGLVPPDEFISLAEETGLILPIGQWVMEATCAQIKVWENDALTSELQVAVNVSARQFRQPDFVAQLQRVLTTSDINPARLKLELTESMLLEDTQDIVAKMQVIKQLGVCFSLDDFGTGYSSLAYLAQLPLDQIKIDKSFVRNLPGANKDETIVRAIITMGLGLNLNVIAEGVETERQRQFLEAHGCHEYQGYLFGRALPLQELEASLKHI
jgi:diguanylate cyclase (GGDEF)-like protein/PAS domain S-box-containing protein